MIVYIARWLVPVSTPPVENAAVAVEGDRIVAAGRRKDVLKSAGDGASERDLGDVVLLPGLVNAHTHVELSWMGATPLALPSYADWIRGLLAKRAQEDEGVAKAAAETAARTMAEFGIVAVGDVGNRTWPASVLARSGLHAVAFHEIYGFKTAEAEALVDAAAKTLDRIESDPDFARARARVSVSLTAHSLYTTSAPLLKALAGRASASREPFSIHVAESEEEVTFLRDGSGPLRDLLEERGIWDPGFHPPNLSPVEYLDRHGALTPRTLAVHCVHVDHQDLGKLQSRGVTVVTCPRSNAMLRVGRAPIPKILTSGIPVAIGTDSLASAPDLDLFAEMAALRQEHPGLAPAAVLRMATANGAKALGFARDLGTIEAGKLASLVVIPMAEDGDDPVEIATSAPAVTMTLDRAPWEAPAS
jgi:cytosine/adenosine deaminase-related metal-dependent hydrolase